MNRLICLILVCAMLFVSVYAETTPSEINISAKVDMDRVVISGTLPVWEGTDITLMVSNIGKNISDLTPRNMLEIINYQSQTQADEDGNFIFDYMMSGDRGEYTYFIEADGYRFGYSDTFEYFGSTYVKNDVLSPINVAKENGDSLTVKSLIESNYTALGITEGHYLDFIANSDKDNELYERIVKMKDVSLPQELLSQLEEAAMLLIIKYSTDVTATVKSFEDELGLTSNSAYATYCDATIITAEQQSEIAGKYVGEDIFSISDFVKVFQNDVILTATNTAASYGELQRTVISNKDIIGITKMPEYETLTNKEKVFIELYGDKFTSITDIRDKVDAAIVVVKGNSGNNGNNGDLGGENGSSSGGGGGASGGGGFKTSGGTANIVIPENVNLNAGKTNFTDMNNFEWAKEAVDILYLRKIINGTGNNEFAPERDVTREEFVKMLVIAVGMSGSTSKIDFDDVSQSEWYYPYIVNAVENGLIFGTSEKLFGIGEKLTREDMAVITYRALAKLGYGNKDNNSENTFSDDSEISEYAKKSIKLLNTSGIINGMGDGSFSPRTYSNRAQAAVVIYRILSLINMI